MIGLELESPVNELLPHAGVGGARTPVSGACTNYTELTFFAHVVSKKTSEDGRTVGGLAGWFSEFPGGNEGGQLPLEAGECS